MPHFVVTSNEDGTVRQILKDGEPYEGSLQLEQAFSVVTIYFQLAVLNLAQMNGEERSERRKFGLQSFLMSLTGLEAFANTFFHLLGRHLGSDELLSRVSQPHGSLSQKFRDLIALMPGGPIRDQQLLIDKVFELSQIRNAIVHPRWVPASVTMEGSGPITFRDMVENRQALFEDIQFCRESLFWCLLMLARIGEARENADVSGFMFHWTQCYNVTLSGILGELGLSDNSATA